MEVRIILARGEDYDFAPQQWEAYTELAVSMAERLKLPAVTRLTLEREHAKADEPKGQGDAPV
jgi:hypothetical protein